jgi:hypothetical protein
MSPLDPPPLSLSLCLYDRPGFDSQLGTTMEIPLLSSSSEDLERASKKEWHQATRKQIYRSGIGKWGWGIGGVWEWVSGVKSYDSKQAVPTFEKDIVPVPTFEKFRFRFQPHI